MTPDFTEILTALGIKLGIIETYAFDCLKSNTRIEPRIMYKTSPHNRTEIYKAFRKLEGWGLAKRVTRKEPDGWENMTSKEQKQYMCDNDIYKFDFNKILVYECVPFQVLIDEKIKRLESLRPRLTG